MKPLQSAPFTEEDWKIWRHVVRRFGKKTTRVNKLAGWSFDSDFRDAELMFERMGHWEWGRTPPHKWWFEDWPGPEGRSRTPFDGACYYWSSQ
jgi:hypothetical protein